MGKFSGWQGKRTYIWAKNVQDVEQYCAEKNIEFNAGINRIIEEHFANDATQEDKNVVRDLKKIERKLDFISLIIQPSFLELLEVSGQLRSLVHDSERSGRDGKKVRKVFEGLYTQLLALKVRKDAE